MEYIELQKQTSKTKKHYKKMKVAIYALLIAFIAFTTAFSYILKKNTEENFIKDIKISTLVSELGEVKASLDTNQQIISGLFNELNATKNTLAEMNKNIVKKIQEKEMNWVSIESGLYETQGRLNALLEEKDIIISQLSSENKQLNYEINSYEYDPNILDILILGQNASLVDTIIVVSANLQTKKISIFSLPRDLYYNGRKINELYHYYGIQELQKAVYETTGVNPDKYILFDFQSFIDFIDAIGGVEVYIEKDIIDNAYPGPNRSYTVVKFSAGSQTMDGETALKYTRSRKSTSDFDRSYRQQQVISSVKQRILQLDLISKLDLSTKIYASVKENIKTDIGFFEALDYLQKYSNYELKTGNVLSTQNYLYSTTNAKGQYILLPKGNSYESIKKFVQELITT